MREFLARAFGCDVRALATFRIALGLLLVADIAWRIPFYNAWLGEAGMWPIAAAQAEHPRAWSLYFLSVSSGWTNFLLALASGAALALIVGWRTRIATVVSWVLLVSLQTRNELPLNAGDILLRLLLFFGCFLPLGGCWAVDARGKKSAMRGASVAIGALLVQVALIYVFNALYKTGAAWQTGTAVEIVLRQETYATAFGSWLLAWPLLLAAVTRATWWFELLGPFLAFVPWKTGVFRGSTALCFMGFHLALFATLRIGLFPLICIAAWILFLPSGFWDRFSSARGKTSIGQSRPVPFEIIAGLAITLIVASNVLRYAGVARPPWMRWPTNILRLDQQWSLFAPDPSRTEGWLMTVIETDAGKEFDAFSGQEVDWNRPANLGALLPSGQWRKFLAAVRNPRFPKRAQLFAQWRVAEWQRQHPEIPARRVRLHYLWEWLDRRQSPPDNWFIYENPPGPMTETARQLGYPPAPPGDSSDL
jgi:hypothetical protein